MRIEAELDDDQMDICVAMRLDALADNMENYLHSAEVPLKGDIKDYKMLIRAANYFKVPNEQRKPLKFVARKRTDDLIRKKGRKHKKDVLYTETGLDSGSKWEF
jgi:hypothetical protein